MRSTRAICAGTVLVALIGLGAQVNHAIGGQPLSGPGVALADDTDDWVQQQQEQDELQQQLDEQQQAEQQNELAQQQALMDEQQGLLTEQQANLAVPGS